MPKQLQWRSSRTSVGSTSDLNSIKFQFLLKFVLKNLNSFHFRFCFFRACGYLCVQLFVRNTKKEKAKDVDLLGWTIASEEIRREHLRGAETRHSLPFGSATGSAKYRLIKNFVTFFRFSELEFSKNLLEVVKNFSFKSLNRINAVMEWFQ